MAEEKSGTSIKTHVIYRLHQEEMNRGEPGFEGGVARERRRSIGKSLLVYLKYRLGIRKCDLQL